MVKIASESWFVLAVYIHTYSINGSLWLGLPNLFAGKTLQRACAAKRIVVKTALARPSECQEVQKPPLLLVRLREHRN